MSAQAHSSWSPNAPFICLMFFSPFVWVAVFNVLHRRFPHEAWVLQCLRAICFGGVGLVSLISIFAESQVRHEVYILFRSQFPNLISTKSVVVPWLAAIWFGHVLFRFYASAHLSYEWRGVFLLLWAKNALFSLCWLVLTLTVAIAVFVMMIFVITTELFGVVILLVFAVALVLLPVWLKDIFPQQKRTLNTLRMLWGFLSLLVVVFVLFSSAPPAFWWGFDILTKWFTVTLFVAQGIIVFLDWRSERFRVLINEDASELEVL